MAPEQLQGKEADARSDIFSFGCVLYEMLSGKKAFSGSSTASVIAAILEREPEPLATTPPLDRVIRTCLAKDPDQRFQNALDLKKALLWAMEPVTAGPAAASPVTWMIATATLALLAAGISFVHFRETPPKVPVIRTIIDPPAGTEFATSGSLVTVATPALSPDGRRLVFGARSEGKLKLWIRSLDAIAAQPLPGTEDAIHPFWSPDSRFVAFFAGGKLRKIDISGGLLFRSAMRRRGAAVPGARKASSCSPPASPEFNASPRQAVSPPRFSRRAVGLPSCLMAGTSCFQAPLTLNSARSIPPNPHRWLKPFRSACIRRANTLSAGKLADGPAV